MYLQSILTLTIYSDELKKHENKHRNVKWDCYACSFQGYDMQELTQHILQEHERGKFRCIKEGCLFISSTRADAERHYKGNQHTGPSSSSDDANTAVAGPSNKGDYKKKVPSSKNDANVTAPVAQFSSSVKKEPVYNILGVKCFLDGLIFT